MKLVSHCGTGMNVAHLKSIRMFFLGLHVKIKEIMNALSKHETYDILPFFESSLFLNTRQSPTCRCCWKKESHESDFRLSTPQFRKSTGVVRKTIQQRRDDATLMQPQLAKKGVFFKENLHLYKYAG